jgi:toxin ParE1/3/4
MRTVIQSPEAQDDISEQLAYLDARSPAAALRFAADIEARPQMLAGQPTMGRARDDLAPGLRSTVVGKFILVYTFTEDELRVVRVLHRSSDIGRILSDDTD